VDIDIPWKAERASEASFCVPMPTPALFFPCAHCASLRAVLGTARERNIYARLRVHFLLPVFQIRLATGAMLRRAASATRQESTERSSNSVLGAEAAPNGSQSLCRS
jgi:hypothetical protein